MIADTNAVKRSRWSTQLRWILHTTILCVPILLSIFFYTIGHQGKLPQSGFKLFQFILFELFLWGFTFAAAFKISGISMTQLYLRAANPLRTLIYGFGFFVLIRIAVLCVFLVQMIWVHPNNMLSGTEKVFALMDASNIMRHPTFSFIVFGIVSLYAGSAEEMWRVGMLAGLQGIFPWLKTGKKGILTCIGVVSLIFGVAHLYLGWVGVENAILVGFFFGLIVVYRRSYWEAAIAHAFFDAFSFAAVSFIVLHPQILNAMLIAEAIRGDIPKVEHVLKLGVDVNGTFGHEKITALEMAAQHGDTDLVNFLLEKGANPNAVDGLGRTPLMNAAAKGKLETIKLLLAKGAEINQKDKNGFTVLIYAAQGHPDTVQSLIDLGADVNARDNAGETPLAFVRHNGYAESAAILEKNGGK